MISGAIRVVYKLTVNAGTRSPIKVVGSRLGLSSPDKAEKEGEAVDSATDDNGHGEKKTGEAVKF
jgi:hypothetical protein